jgi:hypothetical protein
MKRVFVKEEYLDSWTENHLNKNGVIIRTDTHYSLKPFVRDWIKDRCVGHWEHYGAMKYIVFEDDSEALLFKLRWG